MFDMDEYLQTIYDKSSESVEQDKLNAIKDYKKNKQIKEILNKVVWIYKDTMEKFKYEDRNDSKNHIYTHDEFIKAGYKGNCWDMVEYLRPMLEAVAYNVKTWFIDWWENPLKEIYHTHTYITFTLDNDDKLGPVFALECSWSGHEGILMFKNDGDCIGCYMNWLTNSNNASSIKNKSYHPYSSKNPKWNDFFTCSRQKSLQYFKMCTIKGHIENYNCIKPEVIIQDYVKLVGEEEKSEELFGFSKKEKEKTLEDIKKSDKYNKNLPIKLLSEFKNAWNYRAYKLPISLGKNSDGEEADKDIQGFEDNIIETDFEPFDYSEKISHNHYIIDMNGIFQFAYGQPTEYSIYWKTMKDIETRWKKRLFERAEKVKLQYFKDIDGVEISVNIDTGDGDEGCIYPTVSINIPVKYFLETE